MNATQVNHPNIATLTETEVSNLALRLEEDDYSTPFEALSDWHLLRALAFQRPELVEPYLYLLDLEAFDES
jgi:type IV secretory pathway ATPase VirB11/archaellum biosynthesis ATPase